MRRITQYLKNVLVAWIFSVIILLIYVICIIRPINWVGIFEDTYVQMIIFYPLTSLPFLGPFMILYVAFRFNEYKKTRFLYSLLLHIGSYILFYLMIRLLYWGSANFTIISWINTVFSLSIYFSIHILIMQFLVNKFKLFAE